MRDLDSTLRELSGLADRPPAPPRDLASVAARGRAIRRRRLAGNAFPAVLLVAALALVAVWGDRDRGDDTVAVDPPTTTTVPEGAEGEGARLRVVPATDLIDGAMVEIVLAEDPGGPLVAMQCAFAVRSDADVAGRCNDEVSIIRADEAGPLDAVQVTRYQYRGRGSVYDCAHPTWPCFLVVIPGTPTDVDYERAVTIRLGFVDDEELVVVSDDRPANGDVITISGSGLPWDTQMSVVQCQPSESMPDYERCDALRGKSVTTDAEGRFETRFQVSEVIRPWYSWDEAQCRSCVIRVSAGHISAEVDLEVKPNLEPVRPRFEIVEDGPFTPGQPVTIVGSGFQIEVENDYEKPYPEWCIIGTDPLVCGSPGEPYERVDIGDGEYLYQGFLMPHGLFGERCLTEPCMVTWTRGDGTPPAAIVDIDLVPE